MSTLKTTNLQHPSAAAPAVVLAADGSAAATLGSVNGGPLAGLRNVIINGGMLIDQRNSGAVQTFTNGAELAYCVDRWYAFCSGANVTGQPVLGANASKYRYLFTGAALTTNITFAQRIEAQNCGGLAGGPATLSVDLANSLLTSVTWTAYHPTSADQHGTRANPTRTQIATGTFTVNSTVSRYSTTINMPANAAWGIEIVFSVGAQTSGTWTIGDVQLEKGSVATPFENRPVGMELALCQRYYWRGQPCISFNYPAYAGSSVMGWPIVFPVELRVSPTLGSSLTGATYGGGGSFLNWSAQTKSAARFTLVTSGASTNVFVTFQPTNYLDASAEL